jgi:hypothetical protein
MFFPEVSGVGPQILQFAGYSGPQNRLQEFCVRDRIVRVAHEKRQDVELFLGDMHLLVGLPHDWVLQVDFETPARRISGFVVSSRCVPRYSIV